MSRSHLRKDASREFRIIVRGYNDRKLNEVRERFSSFVTLNAIGNAIEIPMIRTLAIIASSGISTTGAKKLLEEVRDYCPSKGIPQRSGELQE